MKPAVVLGLVGVAIAALLFVLFSDPLVPTDTGGSDGIGPSASTVDIRRSDDRSTDLILEEGERFAAGVANIQDVEEREAVGSTTDLIEGAYSNEIAGTVTTKDGAPIEGARVTLVKSSFGSLGSPLQLAADRHGKREAWTAYSASDGTFSFRSLVPGNDYVVAAEHDDYSKAERPGLGVSPTGVSRVVLKMSTGYTLSGIVLDNATGAPIKSAQILLQGVLAMLPGADKGQGMKTVSAEDGSYSFKNVSAGTRTVTVTAKGYGSRTRNNKLFQGSVDDPIVQDFRLDIGQFMTGRVIGPDGSGIQGAAIDVSSYETVQISRGIGSTDRDGYFKIEDLAEGKYMLVARANGFSDHRMTRVGLSDNPQITMARQGGVMGFVVTIDGSEKISKFRAMVRSVAPGSTSYGRTVSQGNFSNDDGTYELGGLEAGNYVVQVEAEGYAPTYSETFVVSLGLITPDVRVAVGQGGSLTGRLVNSVTGEPVTGALVETYDNNFVSNPFTEMLGAMVPRTTTARKTRSDKDGNFKLELMAAATYQLQIDHADFPRKLIKDVQVREGSESDLSTIRMAAGAIIRGTVYDAAGRPLADAKINLSGDYAYPGVIRSDPDGRFVLSNVQEGTYRLSAVRPGNSAAGNPFGPIIDMKKSEVRITVFEGREITQNLNMGG